MPTAPITLKDAMSSPTDTTGTSTTLITNIASLVTNDPSSGDGSALGLIQDAAVVIDGDRIAWTGDSREAPATDNRVDAGGRAVIPGFVDSHSHLVFAGDRTQEFNARMSGRAYSAGGIRTTVAATRAATDRELERTLTRHLDEALRQGTTTFETKSGYGLTVQDEARALRIASAHTDEVTYLGAHIVPPDHADDPAGYVALVTGEMLDACAPYARWIDVFCEKGAFDGDQARAILTAGRAKGLHPRIHANQLSYGPGVQLAVELDAASADHCTHLTDADVDALANGGTVATLLPGAEFSTRAKWPDARRLLDAGATVALSTDCNPGSSFTSSVPFCIALAVRDMGMTPDEAVWSATAGGAAALRRDDIGRLVPGARADLLVLDAPSHVHLAYRPGVPLVSAVWREGAEVSGRRTDAGS
ncbi:imidazolonepropionase [Streptomyces sp. V3I8]|nr:imidazolonepropionase [Streptomyces sp. V3I8]